MILKEKTSHSARERHRPAELLSQRLAKGLAHPLRVHILVELNKRRELSPTQFKDITGVPEPVDVIAKHFRRLERLGCIEQLSTRRAGRTVERVFRAIRRPVFDDAAWKALPPQAHKGITAKAFGTYVECIAEAIAAGTFDARPEAQFAWMTLRLDEIAWRSMIRAADAQFWLSLDLKVEAELRLAASEEEPILVTSGLAVIEAPADSTGVGELHAAPFFLEKEGELLFNGHLAAALTHSLRVRILLALSKWPMSPKDFHERFGAQLGVTLPKVSQHFRRLEELGCIEQVGLRRTVRGAPAHLFAPCRRDLFDGADWQVLPPSLAEEVLALSVTSYIEAVAASVAAEVIDQRLDSHLSWVGMRYDEEAWHTFTHGMRALERYSKQLNSEAAERLQDASEPGIPVVVNFGCFESPRHAPITSDTTWRTLERENRPNRPMLRAEMESLLRRLGDPPPTPL